MSRKKSRVGTQSAQNLHVNDSHPRYKTPKIPPFALKEALPALAVRARSAPVSLAALLARHQARQRLKQPPRPPVVAHPGLAAWQAGSSSGYALSYGSQATSRSQPAQEGDA